MNHQKSSSRTLLMSVLMSAQGPLLLGIGLLSGRSATQIADFIRRSAELLALIMAYMIYRLTTKDQSCDENRKAKLEKMSNIFVGTMMCLGGSIMFVLALISSNEDPGNVIPALAIALMGVVANTLFWLKYTRLNRESPNAIIAVQARLYKVKSMVDLCVTIALLSVFIAPASPVSFYLDKIGSAIVALYLAWTGAKTIHEKLRT